MKSPRRKSSLNSPAGQPFAKSAAPSDAIAQPLAQPLAHAAQVAQSGQFEQAIALCQEILARSPQTAGAYHLLGMVDLQRQQYQTAQQHFERAIALERNTAEYYNYAGVAAAQLGDFEGAIAHAQRAVALQPTALDYRYNLALALQKNHQPETAISHFETLLQQEPRLLAARYHLGNAYQALQDYETAIAHYRQVLSGFNQPEQASSPLNRTFSVRPEAVWYNLGVALQAQRDYAAAKVAYEQAIALRPQYGEALNALGTLLERQEQSEAAIALYQQALTLMPNYLPLLSNLGNLHLRQKQWAAAEHYFRRTLEQNPQNLQAIDGLGKLATETCQWDNLDALVQQLWEVGKAQISTDIALYHTLFLPLSAQQLQILAENHGQAIAQRVATLKQSLSFSFPNPNSPAQTSARDSAETPTLRIGYVSGDYRNQAVGNLIAQLFELHDRQQFRTYAYSLGMDDGSELRRKFEADADVFRDLKGQSSQAIAQQIYQDGIDILIDLEGYTEYAQVEIYALRPAPLIVSYLGHTSTMGLPEIDYVLTDAAIAPPQVAEFLTEHCLYLPSYQLNNNHQPLPGTVPSRREHGLPEEGIVFCGFNKVQKLQPEIFIVWMRILAQVPNSVLWLLASNPIAQQNLIAAAERMGIAGDRLIFASSAGRAEHFTRLQCADLFLDTLYHNAQATGSDALWVGVPLLTCPGDTFASRVAASLLTAVDLPELIAPNLAEYERLAIHLATHPEELRSLKHRLIQNRLTCDLFNSERTVRHLESAYHRIWENDQMGNPPQQIYVPEISQPATSNTDSPLNAPLSDRTPQIASTQTQPAIPQPSTPFLQADAGFQTWLSQSQGSLLVSTYQSNMLYLLGWNGQQMAGAMRQFPQPRGIAIQGDRLALALEQSVMLFANYPELARTCSPSKSEQSESGQYDALFLPRQTYFTGAIYLHEMSFCRDELWMVNTAFSCLCTVSADYSFVPRWQPPFISALVPEDRCHLNGLAVVNDQPKYVTLRAESDTSFGWRSPQLSSGILMDVETGEMLVRGLCLPHCPRWHHETLWFLNSGKGELCRVNPETGEVTVISVLPGFLRGLTFVGDYAIIGINPIRSGFEQQDLPIQQQFDRLISGVAVVNLASGAIAGLLEFPSEHQEISDLQFLPRFQRPNLLSPDKAIVKQAIVTPETVFWMRPES